LLVRCMSYEDEGAREHVDHAIIIKINLKFTYY
jgi:hypothetical protein